MKIGYPCRNNSIGCTSSKTFRLRNYSPDNLIKKTTKNIKCLEKTLSYNVKNNIFFFRITSDLVPFASHRVCKYNWQEHFKGDLKRIGMLIKKNNIRISMHPDQFIILNSKKERVCSNSIKELEYHARVLELMELDQTAKIQLHVGGVYGDKNTSIKRFINNYDEIKDKIKKRLVIENDDKSYTSADCLYINSKTGVPVLFDYFHHRLNNAGEDTGTLVKKIISTWKRKDGPPMMDYSSQLEGERRGRHAEHIEVKDFKKFLKILENTDKDIDIMLEIKDKEKSALKAGKILDDKTEIGKT